MKYDDKEKINENNFILNSGHGLFQAFTGYFNFIF